MPLPLFVFLVGTTTTILIILAGVVDTSGSVLPIISDDTFITLKGVTDKPFLAGTEIIDQFECSETAIQRSVDATFHVCSNGPCCGYNNALTNPDDYGVGRYRCSISINTFLVKMDRYTTGTGWQLCACAIDVDTFKASCLSLPELLPGAVNITDITPAELKEGTNEVVAGTHVTVTTECSIVDRISYMLCDSGPCCKYSDPEHIMWLHSSHDCQENSFDYNFRLSYGYDVAAHNASNTMVCACDTASVASGDVFHSCQVLPKIIPPSVQISVADDFQEELYGGDRVSIDVTCSGYVQQDLNYHLCKGGSCCNASRGVIGDGCVNGYTQMDIPLDTFGDDLQICACDGNGVTAGCVDLPEIQAPNAQVELAQSISATDPDEVDPGNYYVNTSCNGFTFMHNYLCFKGPCCQSSDPTYVYVWPSQNCGRQPQVKHFNYRGTFNFRGTLHPGTYFHCLCNKAGTYTYQTCKTMTMKDDGIWIQDSSNGLNFLNENLTIFGGNAALSVVWWGSKYYRLYLGVCLDEGGTCTEESSITSLSSRSYGKGDSFALAELTQIFSTVAFVSLQICPFFKLDDYYSSSTYTAIPDYCKKFNWQRYSVELNVDDNNANRFVRWAGGSTNLNAVCRGDYFDVTMSLMEFSESSKTNAASIKNNANMPSLTCFGVTDTYRTTLPMNAVGLHQFCGTDYSSAITACTCPFKVIPRRLFTARLMSESSFSNNSVVGELFTFRWYSFGVGQVIVYYCFEEEFCDPVTDPSAKTYNSRNVLVMLDSYTKVEKGFSGIVALERPYLYVGGFKQYAVDVCVQDTELSDLRACLSNSFVISNSSLHGLEKTTNLTAYELTTCNELQEEPAWIMETVDKTVQRASCYQKIEAAFCSTANGGYTAYSYPSTKSCMAQCDANDDCVAFVMAGSTCQIFHSACEGKGYYTNRVLYVKLEETCLGEDRTVTTDDNSTTVSIDATSTPEIGDCRIITEAGVVSNDIDVLYNYTDDRTADFCLSFTQAEQDCQPGSSRQHRCEKLVNMETCECTFTVSLNRVKLAGKDKLIVFNQNASGYILSTQYNAKSSLPARLVGTNRIVVWFLRGPSDKNRALSFEYRQYPGYPVLESTSSEVTFLATPTFLPIRGALMGVLTTRANGFVNLRSLLDNLLPDSITICPQPNPEYDGAKTEGVFIASGLYVYSEAITYFRSSETNYFYGNQVAYFNSSRDSGEGIDCGHVKLRLTARTDPSSDSFDLAYTGAAIAFGEMVSLYNMDYYSLIHSDSPYIMYNGVGPGHSCDGMIKLVSLYGVISDFSGSGDYLPSMECGFEIPSNSRLQCSDVELAEGDELIIDTQGALRVFNHTHNISGDMEFFSVSMVYFRSDDNPDTVAGGFTCYFSNSNFQYFTEPICPEGTELNAHRNPIQPSVCVPTQNCSDFRTEQAEANLAPLINRTCVWNCAPEDYDCIEQSGCIVGADTTTNTFTTTSTTITVSTVVVTCDPGYFYDPIFLQCILCTNGFQPNSNHQITYCNPFSVSYCLEDIEIFDQGTSTRDSRCVLPSKHYYSYSMMTSMSNSSGTCSRPQTHFECERAANALGFRFLEEKNEEVLYSNYSFKECYFIDGEAVWALPLNGTGFDLLFPCKEANKCTEDNVLYAEFGCGEDTPSIVYALLGIIFAITVCCLCFSACAMDKKERELQLYLMVLGSIMDISTDIVYLIYEPFVSDRLFYACAGIIAFPLVILTLIFWPMVRKPTEIRPKFKNQFVQFLWLLFQPVVLTLLFGLGAMISLGIRQPYSKYKGFIKYMWKDKVGFKRLRETWKSVWQTPYPIHGKYLRDEKGELELDANGQKQAKTQKFWQKSLAHLFIACVLTPAFIALGFTLTILLYIVMCILCFGLAIVGSLFGFLAGGFVLTIPVIYAVLQLLRLFVLSPRSFKAFEDLVTRCCEYMDKKLFTKGFWAPLKFTKRNNREDVMNYAVYILVIEFICETCPQIGIQIYNNLERGEWSEIGVFSLVFSVIIVLNTLYRWSCAKYCGSNSGTGGHPQPTKPVTRLYPTSNPIHVP